MGKSRRARKKMLEQAFKKNSTTSAYAAALLKAGGGDAATDTKEGMGKGASSLGLGVSGSSSGGQKAVGLTKKKKRRDKKINFHQKLDIPKTDAITTESEKKSKRESMLDTLNELETSLANAVKSDDSKRIRPAKKLSNRQRKRLVSKEVENFCAVMQHPAFKTNPLDTISEHLQNSIKAKEEAERGVQIDESAMI
mmetsp:Transcript_13442/g.24334  ORF Transcript_13442/g.24334 Transcript_13442/m.24334 type:complete len:196 (-) Transcript_13442:53-640(-)